MLQISLKAPGQFATDDIPEPTGELAPGQVLVRVHRVGVCGTDLHAFAGRDGVQAEPRLLLHLDVRPGQLARQIWGQMFDA